MSEETTPEIDAVAVVLCQREVRSRGGSFDQVVAPNRELWMRYRYEAKTLLNDLEYAGVFGAVRADQIKKDAAIALEREYAEDTITDADDKAASRARAIAAAIRAQLPEGNTDE